MTKNKLIILSFGVSWGAALAAEAQPGFEGGFTATYQDSDDNRIKEETLASIHLATTIPAGEGSWSLVVEGNASPRLQGVSSVLGETNGDAGSARDRDDKGRFQVSELNYTRLVGGAEITVGLINAAGFLDTSNVANDETAQFLGTSFVNNPTIEFPDYTLGIVYHHDLQQDALDFTIVITSSHGLGDNTNKSYSELFDVSATGKGTFAAAEFSWANKAITLRAGYWINTSDHTNLSSTSTTESNSGIYGVIDGSLNELNWGVRLGIADDDVSESASFISLAAEYPVGSTNIGLGIAQTALANQAKTATKDDIQHAELYARFPVMENLELTPSAQLIENSGFESSGISFDKSNTVLSLRANYTF